MREGGASLVNPVQLRAQGPVCEGWPVTLTWLLCEWRPPLVLWSEFKELCPFSGPSGVATGAWPSLSSKAPLLWLENKHLLG